MKLPERVGNLIFKKPGEERRDGKILDGGRRRGENENPYLAARRTWNELMAASLANRQMWQLFGILALMITLAAVGGMIYIGSQSKFIPYVVEVDRHGETIAIAPAQRAGKADPRVVHANVASFISERPYRNRWPQAQGDSGAAAARA